MAETAPQREQEAERDFLTLHEFVKLARIKLSSGVWDYLTGGSETETTLRRNRQALEFDRLPPARAARRVEDRLLGHALRQEAAHPGAACAGGLDRGVRRGRRRRRGESGAALRRRLARQLGEPARPRGGGGGGARRPHHLPALCPRRPRLGRRSRAARDRRRLRGLLLHHRHRDLQPARARSRQALPSDWPASRERTASSRPRSTGTTSSASRTSGTIPLILKGIATAEDAETALGPRRRCDLRLEPRRAAARSRPRHASRCCPRSSPR